MLRVTITLSEENKPYKHIRYYTCKTKGNYEKFNKLYKLADKLVRFQD